MVKICPFCTRETDKGLYKCRHCGQVYCNHCRKSTYFFGGYCPKCKKTNSSKTQY